MRLLLLLVLVTLQISVAQASPREMFLAGGALHLCSSVAREDCKVIPPGFADARGETRYRIDNDGISRALSKQLWPPRKGAPKREELRILLHAARHNTGQRDLDGAAISDAFDRLCILHHRALPCMTRDDRKRPWRSMVDAERSTLLAALEVPVLDGGKRLLEVASLDDSIRPEGAQILRAFVAAAAERAGGRPPVIAVVTAAAQDPFDPVDFYLSALREAGAEPVWWPVDAALASTLLDKRGCATLDDARMETLGLPARSVVFPDLAALQQHACEHPADLLETVDRVQGVFFTGGDQWRLREAFFDGRDRPYAWLTALRAAYRRGDVVIAGTSAGTAVQSGLAMPSNGEAVNALMQGAIATAPPEAGCARARRCAAGIDENDMTYWPAGGLGLEPGWVFDTHFSERARELRLLRLLYDSGAATGMGIDETSAVHLRGLDQGLEIETLGASGAWLFERTHQGEPRGQLQARVHYLAPGATLTWTQDQLRISGQLPVAAVEPPRQVEAPADALSTGALRAIATRLVATVPNAYVLRAGPGWARLSRTAATRFWVGPGGQTGITDLELDWTVFRPSDADENLNHP